MKKILAALLALVSSLAFGATLAPVQLLNPAGSTSGQAIISSGPSTAPSWGSVPLSGLATQAANTVLANATASSAAPAAFAMPSCSATGNALNYTSGTGFTCNTSLFSSPTITTPNIVGVTNASSAAAGSVGELIQSQVTTNTAWAPATGVAGNLTSIILTAGDWEVSGNVWWAAAAGSGVWTSVYSGINTTSATLPSGYLQIQQNQATGAAVNIGYVVPSQRINVTTSTNVYLAGIVTYASGTMNYQCQLRARRIR